jgi:EAL domain-containing protein (putative c-di-GMP-specific phosphodiesterase class I)
MIAEAFAAAIRRPYRLPGGRARAFLSAAVGVARYPTDGAEFAQLLDAAAMAARAASRAGDTVAFASQHVRREAAIETAVCRLLLARPRIDLQYQPLVALADQALVGIEALARWPRDEPILEAGPAEFVPAAERCGTDVMCALDMAVLRQACIDRRDWRAAFTGAHADEAPSDQSPRGAARTTLNVSPVSLSDPRFAERFLAELARHGARPEEFEIDVTETGPVKLSVFIDQLRTLRLAGVRLCLDDFGAGCSSLAWLHDLPVSAIKFARPFVESCMRDARSMLVLKFGVEVARAFGVTTIAKGVGHQALHDYLRLLCIDIGQGDYYLRAVPIGELVAAARRRPV